MHIVVVGAGEVGTYIASRLSGEGHDIAMVERDRIRLRKLEEELDIQTVFGSGTIPATLTEAGIRRADLLVAVTSIDEVNVVSAMLGKRMGVPKVIARIEQTGADDRDATEMYEAIGIDLVIDPDHETASEILPLLEFRGASEVAEMADGEIVVMGARLGADAPFAGRTLADIAAEYEPEWEFLFGAISRGDQTIIPRGNHTIEAGDLLRVVCKKRARRQLAALLGLERARPRKVMLLGGGRTAALVAEEVLGDGAEVLIVERVPERARELSETLHKAAIVLGEITDADLLNDLEIGSYDAVLALTGEDDANILACLFAKSGGAKETIAVVHRLSLLPLLVEEGIDVALSPRTASANAVLRFVRGDVAEVKTFLQGEVEVLEVEVHEGSPADNGIVAELRLPKDVLVGAIVRDGKAQIARGRSVLRDRDHVIVFAMPDSVEEARQIFG